MSSSTDLRVPVPDAPARWPLILSAVALTVHTLILAIPPAFPHVDGGWYLTSTNPLPIVVEFVLVLVTSATFFVHPHLRASAMVRATAVAAAVVLTLGLSSYTHCEGEGARGITSLIWTLKLFIGEFDEPFGATSDAPLCPAAPPVAIQAAQILAMTVVLASVATVVRELFRGDWNRQRVRRAPSITLVVDSDSETAQYLSWLTSRHCGPDGTTGSGATVRPPLIVVAEAEGALASDHPPGGDRENRLVRIAAGHTLEALAPFLVRGGRTALHEMHLLSPNAHANRRLLAQLRESFEVLETPDRIDVVVRIDDPWTAEEWRRKHLGDDGPWVLDATGIHEATARAILARAQEAACTEILAIGTTPLVIALAHEHAAILREAARLRQILDAEATSHGGRVPPSDIVMATRVPRLAIVGPHAEELLRQHRLQQSQYGLTASDATAHPTAGPATPADVDRATSGDPRTVVIVADDPHSVEPLTAHGVTLDHPDWAVLLHDRSTVGVESQSLEPGLARFSPALELDANHAVTTRERLARLVHNTYRARYATDESTGSLAPWEDLPLFFRESNLRQVSELLENATSIGLQWSAPASEGARAARDAGYEPEGWRMLLLAMAEHESWRQAYLAAGWRQGDTRDDVARTRVDLLPWEALRMDGRRRALAGVRAALGALNSAGYVLSPADDAAPVPAAWDARGWLLLQQTGTVRAERLTEPWEWTLTTADGTTQTMRAEAGHWRVTGTDGGDAWSVEPVAFARDHAETDEPGVYARRGLRLARPVAPGGEAVLSAEDEAAARATNSASTNAPQAPEGRWVLADESGNVWHSDADTVRASHTLIGRPAQPDDLLESRA